MQMWNINLIIKYLHSLKLLYSWRQILTWPLDAWKSSPLIVKNVGWEASQVASYKLGYIDLHYSMSWGIFWCYPPPRFFQSFYRRNLYINNEGRNEENISSRQQVGSCFTYCIVKCFAWWMTRQLQHCLDGICQHTGWGFSYCLHCPLYLYWYQPIAVELMSFLYALTCVFVLVLVLYNLYRILKTLLSLHAIIRLVYSTFGQVEILR